MSSTRASSHVSLWITASRVMAVATLVVVVISFVTAGSLIQYQRALDVHGYAAIALHVTSGGLAVALAALSFERKRSWWAPALAVVLFVYSFVQAYLGTGMTIYLHVPGALAVAVASVWLTAWLFSDQKP